MIEMPDSVITNIIVAIIGMMIMGGIGMVAHSMNRAFRGTDHSVHNLEMSVKMLEHKVRINEEITRKEIVLAEEKAIHEEGFIEELEKL